MAIYSYHLMCKWWGAMENIVDSCADKGCRASVIRNIESTTTSKRSTFMLLEAWKIDAKSESMRMYKRLKLSKTCILNMTPQLILSAVTSTLAANNLQALGPTSSFDGGLRLYVRYSARSPISLEFNVVSKTQRRSKEIRIALQTHLGSVNTIDAYDLELHVEMTSLEFDHIADLAPTLWKSLNNHFQLKYRLWYKIWPLRLFIPRWNICWNTVRQGVQRRACAFGSGARKRLNTD
jgi:hypothetical protein